VENQHLDFASDEQYSFLPSVVHFVLILALVRFCLYRLYFVCSLTVFSNDYCDYGYTNSRTQYTCKRGKSKCRVLFNV